MAKNSQVLRDQKRDKLIAKYASRREELRKQLKNPETEIEEKFAISAALTKLPTNSCPTRKTRRCMLTGRSKAVYRKFGLARMVFRDLALRGEIPGVTKSSW